MSPKKMLVLTGSIFTIIILYHYVNGINPIAQNRLFILSITYVALNLLFYVFLKKIPVQKNKFMHALTISFFLLLTTYVASNIFTLTVNSLQTYSTKDVYFQYPQHWQVETFNIPINEDDYSFYLKSSNPSTDRSTVLTIQILRGRYAHYYFDICCNQKKAEVIGNSYYYATDMQRIDNMIEWNYVSGNGDRLIKFSLGIGSRDDPLPAPTQSEVKKELNEFKLILSTFKFLE